MRSWVKWGLPVSVVVLLAGAGGGAVLADGLYRGPTRSVSTTKFESTDEVVAMNSPGGVAYTQGAAQHPDQQSVMLLLDNHFRSINDRDYDLWKSTVVESKWDELPEAKWRDAYGSTTDLDMKVHRIDPGPDGSLLAMLTFRSHQDVEAAPPDMPYRCLEWNLVYPMVVIDSGRSLRLDTSKLPNSALRAACQE
ncbi:hypothetical protein LZ318_26140 [Saccharopolyspora indica]|uniref:hypothetical protein n=1 Tax=Saccharopolyspora indica TaxID=1229659 RepID=UPI0022EB3D60|nr:hypothetical protein [Saccharopolyspora indica]MDA3648927.1 hypothetical protein [Saccharopolyspora indica]